MLQKSKGFKLVMIIIIVVFLLTGGYQLFLLRVKNIDISFDSLCDGKGALLYDADGKEYQKLDIRYCAQWITAENISGEIKGIINENPEKNYARRISQQFCSNQQMLSAAALQKKYTKEELEEFFWNTVYLGDGIYGIGSAAKHFFGCEYKQMSDREFVQLREIIQTYFKQGNYGDYEGMIYPESMIYEKNGYIDGVIKETAHEMMQAGKSEEEAYHAIFLGELRIDTYLDAEIQTIMEQAYEEKEVFTIDKSDNEYIQSAMLLMSAEGEMKAVVSGNKGDKVFNRALSRKYQVGSTIKPISIYALGIELGKIHFSTMIENEQILIKEGNNYRYWPSNSKDIYGGTQTVTRALQESTNTVAVRVGNMIGVEKIYGFLKDRLGYDLVYYENQNSDYQMSALALGYLYHGIGLQQLTASYEMFANGGYYSNPTLVDKVRDKNGKTVVMKEKKKSQVLSENTAYIMNRLLQQNVYGKYGIAKEAAVDGVEVLGKTGTVTSSDGKTKSQLFVGVTADYIAGIWVGYDGEEDLHRKVYQKPSEIYSAVISRIAHSQKTFVKPEGVIEMNYCEASGMLASDNCKEINLGYYTEDNMPEYCSMCQ